LKALFVVFLICSLISLTAIYQNKKYNPLNKDIFYDMRTANISLPFRKATSPTMLGSVYGAERESLHFKQQGGSDIACCCLLLLFIIFSDSLEARVIRKIDDSTDTTRDYTVEVSNVPLYCSDLSVSMPTYLYKCTNFIILTSRALDKAYTKFFSRLGKVTAISVLKKNGNLLKLIKREEFLRKKVEAHDLEHDKSRVLKTWLATCRCLVCMMTRYRYYEFWQVITLCVRNGSNFLKFF